MWMMIPLLVGASASSGPRCGTAPEADLTLVGRDGAARVIPGIPAAGPAYDYAFRDAFVVLPSICVSELSLEADAAGMRTYHPSVHGSAPVDVPLHPALAVHPAAGDYALLTAGVRRGGRSQSRDQMDDVRTDLQRLMSTAGSR